MKVPITDLHAQYEELREEIDAAIARVLQKSSFVGGEDAKRRLQRDVATVIRRKG